MATSGITDPDQLEKEWLPAIARAEDEPALERLRVSALGKKGVITAQLRALSQLDAAQRQETGRRLNALKNHLLQAIAARLQTLQDRALEDRLARERVDVTLPTRPEQRGSVHPVSRVWEEIVHIFAELGFAVAEGPHIETDWYNFTALNIPRSHPARQEMDTFYFHPDPETGERLLLRTHTSPVQIRAMEKTPPPIRLIAPGRVFRSDWDKTHTPMFHQIEGLVIDRETHMGHLKWCLEEFCRAFFEVDEVEMRFRASHFPFTEPSMEVDIRYHEDGGKVILGQGDKWMEILGSGMVHPAVIRAGGLDPDIYQGFAFGMGLDRITTLKYGIADLRGYFDGDIRWLRHYGFAALDIPTLAGGLS